MIFKKIDHIEAIPQYFDGALSFYAGVLVLQVRNQLKVDSLSLEEVSYLQLGDTILELMRVRDAVAASAGSWKSGYRMMAPGADDMDKTVAYLLSNGVSIKWVPVRQGISKRVQLKDPDGLAIDLRPGQLSIMYACETNSNA